MQSEEIAALLQVKKKKIKVSLSVSVFMLRYSVCIFSSGNLGSQLVEYKEEMYITSDCGKTWRQVRMTNDLQSCFAMTIGVRKKFFTIDSSVTCHKSLVLQHPPFSKRLGSVCPLNSDLCSSCSRSAQFYLTPSHLLPFHCSLCGRLISLS